jgi:hypothetical protein
MVYGNRNSTGVCGTWAAEQEHLKRLHSTSTNPDVAAAVPVWARLRSDEPTAEQVGIDSSNEMQYDYSTDGVSGGASSTMNQAVWMEQQYKLFACNNEQGEPLQYFLYDILADQAETKDLTVELPEVRQLLLIELLYS